MHIWPWEIYPHTHTRVQLALFVEMLHRAIYDIPMKWETTRVTADWCELTCVSKVCLSAVAGDLL